MIDTTYIRALASTAIATVQLRINAALTALQTRIGGARLARAEAQVKNTRAANEVLVRSNRDLRRALDARNKRGVEEALMAGEAQYGDIVTRNALSYERIWFPAAGLTIQPRENGDLEITAPSLNDELILTASDVAFKARGFALIRKVKA